MKIGVLFEGDKDERPLKELIKHIVELLCPGVQLSIVSFVADGPIESKILAAITEFFENKKCDLAIFVSDTDRDHSKRSKLIRKVKDLNAINEPVVVACPDPELEEWFFEEEAAVKAVFGLAGDQPVSYSHLRPKERINKLWVESSILDITVSVIDTYEKIASKMDVSSPTFLKRSSSFLKFYKDFTNLLRKN